MPSSIAILRRDPDNAFAAMPLLGKPCAFYTQAALAEAGVPAVSAEDQPLSTLIPEDVETVLLVMGCVPCLNADTYRALLAASPRPAAVLLDDMVTPLAMALPAALLRTLPDFSSLSALVESLNDQGHAVKVVHAQQAEAYISVTDAASFGAAYQYLRAAFVQKHIANGVVVLDPERTVVEPDVRIGAGTVLYAGNTLQGQTLIGSGCTLYPNNRMDSAIVGDGVTVESSVLLHCVVGAHTTVGPYAYLRPDASIGEGCRIGDFVEIKNSSIGDGTKVSHLTYVGDSDLGKHINLGCGVVFVNYDGKTKNRSTVEDHAFIGCNCNLVAPVHIGENAYLAAGSTITGDVPADALLVARSREVIKPDWVKRRKEQGKL